MTASAQEFISAKTLAVLSGHDVLTDAYFARDSALVEHVDWAQWGDVLLVVPATANSVAKLAQGIADDAFSTLALAFTKDLVVAPAMNDGMWAHPAVQRNVAQLKQDGALIIEPATGFLAEGYQAKGRLAEPADIVSELAVRLHAKHHPLLKGKTVVITAGGTREVIDPVRYLTNRSSGKMGYALAQSAAELGAKVILITAALRKPIYGVETIPVNTAEDMLSAVQNHFEGADLFIGAAAVSDFRVAAVADQKIKKEQLTDQHLQLDLVPNPDILSWAGHHKKNQQLVVGFAAETQALLSHAQDKLAAKKADYVVANDVSRSDIGFDSDQNAVTLLSADQPAQTFASQSKDAIARLILEAVSSKLV